MSMQPTDINIPLIISPAASSPVYSGGGGFGLVWPVYPIYGWYFSTTGLDGVDVGWPNINVIEKMPHGVDCVVNEQGRTIYLKYPSGVWNPTNIGTGGMSFAFESMTGHIPPVKIWNSVDNIIVPDPTLQKPTNIIVERISATSARITWSNLVGSTWIWKTSQGSIGAWTEVVWGTITNPYTDNTLIAGEPLPDYKLHNIIGSFISSGSYWSGLSQRNGGNYRYRRAFRR